MATYKNLCRACNTDFASVEAFDKHRVGSHAYTVAEGMKQNPPVEDGRRCLDASEMPHTKPPLELDSRGRWRIGLTATDKQRPPRHKATSRATALSYR